MGQIVRWLRCVPVWVWLFVAATQIVTLVARSQDLPTLVKAIQAMSNVPADAELKSRFEEIRRDRCRDLIAAAILAPMSLALACWAWSARRRNCTQAAETGSRASAPPSPQHRPS